MPPSAGGSVAPSAQPSAAPPAHSSVAPPLVQRLLPTAIDLRGENGILPLAVGACIVTLALGWFAFSSPDPGTATLAVSPMRARVVLDGKVLEGSSPYTLQEIEPEVPHTLEVSSEGYKSRTETFTLGDGETRSLSEISLIATARDTGFSLASIPVGLQIVLDGKPTRYITPARVLDVAPGMHAVRLTAPDGFTPYEIKVYVSENQVLDLPAAVLAKDVSVVAAPPEAPAPVALAAAVAAPQPLQPVAAPAPPMSAAQKARRAKRREARRARRAARAAGRSAARSGATTGGRGTLRINTRPWSKVYVDGRLIGNTPQFNIKVSAGSHTIKLVNSQMGLTKRIKVRVKAGQTVTKVVNLID